ncbi:50S ribosomal protein L5 [Candidatus Woesearchaeota archaeon]|nr:50S ribosomal protein L5 [Candidatus Woesearchaeota archaeon]
MNPMRTIRIEKITLNIGAGKDQAKLEKGIKLLESITGIKPVKTVSNKRIPAWGVRPGLPIGCKLTLRDKKAAELLKRLLDSRENTLSMKQFDSNGNVSFGISEYINIPEVKYDPEIGIMGLEVCISLERPGFRIKRRKQLKKKIPASHKITKEEAVEFMKKNFNVIMGEEE